MNELIRLLKLWRGGINTERATLAQLLAMGYPTLAAYHKNCFKALNTYGCDLVANHAILHTYLEVSLLDCPDPHRWLACMEEL